MGIKSLWTYLNSKHPYINKLVPQASFKGLRIAFDMGGWIFPMRAQLRSRLIGRTDVIEEPINEELIDEQWLAVLIERIVRFLSAGITPILVFDGPSPPQKTATKLERTKKNDKVLDQIAELRERIKALEATDPIAILEDRPKHLLELQKLMTKISYIPAESMSMIRCFFEGVGIPTFEALGEAERAAAALCREGIAAAAFSPDGDTLVHGCPILIRDVGQDIFDKEGKVQPTFEIVYLRDVLQALGMSQRLFVDFCIMCGCDYNTNLKGIGVVGALSLIKRYRKIGKIPKTELIKAGKRYLKKGEDESILGDISCLDHRTCRELFAPVPSAEQMPNHGEEFSFEVSEVNELAIETFMMYKVVLFQDRYTRCVRKLPVPRDFCHMESAPGYSDDEFEVLDGDELEGVVILEADKRNSKVKAKARKGRAARSTATTGRGRGGMTKGEGARAASSYKN